MAGAPDYEILPHQLLSDLKFDVEALKKKLTQPDSKANELILEIESLKDSIHELNMVFQKALELSKKEDFGSKVVAMNKRIDSVIAQNETIAKGLLAISDKVEEFMSGHKSAPRSPMPAARPQAPPVYHNMGNPPMPGPSRNAPRSTMQMPELVSMPTPAMPPPGVGLPPPPPGKKKHGSLGGLFK